jgi:hypothetical protein
MSKRKRRLTDVPVTEGQGTSEGTSSFGWK